MPQSDSADQDDQARETFAKELGFFVWSWNDLHEGLGHLFSAVIADSMSESALAAWHSHNSDRGQREMLKASAQKALATRPDLLAEVVWLTGQLDALSNKRNNAVHAAYATLNSDGKCTVIANVYYGNRRAQNLAKEEDLTPEIQKYREQTDAFNEFTGGLYQCVIDADRSLPKRPKT